MASDRPKHVVS